MLGRRFVFASAAAVAALVGGSLVQAAEVVVQKNKKPLTLNVEPVEVDHATLEQLGWKLACQFWTFREYSAFETLDILKAMGVKYAEFYPGQRLRPDSDVKVGPEMSDEELNALKQKLADSAVTAMNFGVCKLDKNEENARKTFEFGKKLGLKTLVSEPPEDALPMLDKLAGEYGIGMAIHNHPKPSHYWNPETTVAAVKGLKNVGSCTDIGHFVRSGLSTPESVKKLKGVTRSLHLKDVAPVSAGAGNYFGFGDVVWGTGKVDFPAVVAELKDQKFQGVMSIEYERTTGQDLIDNVRKSVAVLGKLAKGEKVDVQAGAMNTLTEEEKQQGWALLFNGTDTTGWRNYKQQGAPSNWSAKDGVLVNRKGHDLISVETFDNFILDLEFKLPAKGNSGILYRVNESGNLVWHTGPEFQLYDNPGGTGTDGHDCAAAYDMYSPSVNATKPAGEWNHARIVADGTRVEHWLNGQKVVEYDTSSADYKQRFEKSKFKNYKNWGTHKEKRHIALQGDHAEDVQFRNVKVLALPAKTASAK